ncbi:MAG: phosphotransferase [Halioglobus sp.]
MTSRTPPASLLPWAEAVLTTDSPGGRATLSNVAGDASGRRYFRAIIQGRSYMLVHAPPATEKNAAFLAARDWLARAGLRVPEVFAADLEQGFLLLEDLGDRTLLPALNEGSVDALYARAFDALQCLATASIDDPRLAPYDAALLREELSRFDTWFLRGLLARQPGARGSQTCAELGEVLVASALAQPRVLVHRDFHSRNLMLAPDGSLAVIDFQDAVAGPVTYDLVSLLRDCYIRWPEAKVTAWALDYRLRLRRAGCDAGEDEATFLRWFDLMGLQRHIKVLGTFARLALRDGKTGYLEDLPLVLDYVSVILARYAPREPAIARFYNWYLAEIAPAVALEPWSAGA